MATAAVAAAAVAAATGSRRHLLHRRHKTTSAAHIAGRHIDHTFEKHMSTYKQYLRVVAIQDLILGSPSRCLPLAFLFSHAQTLRLNRGPSHFLRKYPHVFSLFHDASSSHLAVRLTPAADAVAVEESSVLTENAPVAVQRLARVLSMSTTKTVPLRAVFKVWKHLGLPDDFEDSIVRKRPDLFQVLANPSERNTHLLRLVHSNASTDRTFAPAVEEWRLREGESVDNKFGFRQNFPPGMKLKKNFRKKVKEWQQLPYFGPYEPVDEKNKSLSGAKTKVGKMAMEKRAVGIAHEFLSLTTEKTVEVEQISQFRKWFGVDLNVRDMFVDHPGIFYLSTKGKRHTVFLREAFERGRLVEPNPVYEVRRKLLHLVLLGRRGMGEVGDGREGQVNSLEELEDVLEDESDVDS